MKESCCPNCGVPLLVGGGHDAPLDGPEETVVSTPVDEDEDLGRDRGARILAYIGAATSGALVTLSVALLAGWGC